MRRLILVLALGMLAGVLLAPLAVQISPAASTSTPLQQAEGIATDAGAVEAKAEALAESLKSAAAQSTLKVGLNDLSGWGAAHTQVVKSTSHIRRDRFDISSFGTFSERAGKLREIVAEGVVPLVVYNPNAATTKMHGLTRSTIQGDIARIAAVMRELGLRELEFGNEVYFQPQGAPLQPEEYAAEYGWAHETLAGSGITLIADCWVDTYLTAKSAWSQVETGGGWGKVFTVSLGKPPDAWSFHPYGSMTASGFGFSGAYKLGWGTVPRLKKYMREGGYNAPLYLTEVGQPTWEGADHNPAVTEAEQAVDVAQYVRDSKSWEVAGLWIFGDVDPGTGGEGGYGLWKRSGSSIGAAKPSATALGEAVLAAGVANN